MRGQSREATLPMRTLKAQRRVNEKDSHSEACFASEGTGDRRKQVRIGSVASLL